jgi:lambda family phage portal protein
MDAAKIIDRLAAAVSPRWAASRDETRRRHALAVKVFERAEARMQAAWEAGDRDRFRGSRWLVSRLSSNSALEQEMATLVERAEDLYRNDAYAASAVNGRVDNVVGKGIRIQARIQAEDVGLPETEAEAINKRLETLWHEWNRVEKYRLKQRLAERNCAVYGESFEVMSDLPAEGKPVDLTVQVISPKRVQTPPGKIGDKRIRLGVEIDRNGAPVAYWIRKSEPGDSLDVNQQFDRIPAWRVNHCFEPMFAGQLRGVPWMAPGMAALKDIKDFAEAHLISEQTAACFSAFVKTSTPYDTAVGAATDTDAYSRRIEDLRPATVEYLRPDEDVIFSNPARPGNTLGPYMMHHLKGFASSIRYPFELLTKTYDNSFSGGRLSLIDGRVAFGCWQQCRIDLACAPLWHRFVHECVIRGLVPEIDPTEYAVNPWPWRRHQWIPPGMEWIDPNVDAESNEKAVSNGFKPKSEIIAGLGGDFDEVLQARTREKIEEARAEKRYQDELAKLGLASDPETGKPGPPAPTPEPETVGAASGRAA